MKTINIPQIWLWTWQTVWNQCKEIIELAINIWYNHIDTAQIYWNEKEVWVWIKNSKINREKIFITSKVRISNFGFKKTIESTENSLKLLWVDYIDLMLLHWPQTKDLHKSSLDWLMKLQSEWKIKYIWVSNFNIDFLEDAQNHTWWQIFVNQFEFHLYLYQEKLVNFCKKNNIIIEAYSPLCSGKTKDDIQLQKIWEKYWKTKFQVMLKRLIQRFDCVILPKSTKLEHLNQNLEIKDFMLDQDDFQLIEKLPKDRRFLNPPFSPKRDQ